GVGQSTLKEVWVGVGVGARMRAACGAWGDSGGSLAAMTSALSYSHEGTPLVDLVGGFGVAAATAAALERMGRKVEGARVVIQGFGSMGGATARYLARKGAVGIGIADVRGLLVDLDGRDGERLFRARDSFGVIARDALQSDARELPRDEWVALECDALVPAALADAINPTNCERVRAELVVEAANLPTAPAADEWLVGRGVTVIPDFVANSATNGWAWWLVLGGIRPTPADALRGIATGR